MSDPEARAKLVSRVEKRRERLEQSLKEKRRLKWFIVLAFSTWPLGLLGGPWYAAWVFVGWLIFWGVGSYSNYFHVKQALTNLKNAEDELASYTVRESAAG